MEAKAEESAWLSGAGALALAACLAVNSLPKLTESAVERADSQVPDLSTARFFPTGGGGVITTTDAAEEAGFANGVRLNNR